MSTKYNRNDSNAGDDKFYLNDHNAELNGVEKDDREQVQDFELLPCIVSGLGLTPAAYPSTNVTVAPGVARDKDGRRIQIASSQLVQISDTGGGNNYVILSHKYSTDTPRKAYSTGTEYNTRKYDDFELNVASTYSADDIVLGNVKVEDSENVLYTEERTPDVAKPVRKEPPPPVPTHLDLETDWDDVFRKTGASAGLVSFRPAYIKAEFGDRGNGTASGITFTKTDNRIGDWTVDGEIGNYLTCADGNSWKVVSNTVDTLTLESGAVPVNGVFHLGPNASGYKFVIQTLDPDTEEVKATAEGESQFMGSPVKMEFIWNGMTPDVKYRIKVASKGGWFQEEWSAFCSPVEIIAGGAKEIPDACGDVLDGDPTITAEDDGIRISWDVKSEYSNKVGGFELCWTDDGTTNPDFDNKNHRKIFTDRNYAVLPAKLSSDGTTVTVKAKMRAVDKAGRHCVTPKSLDDTNAKKYPADLSTIVTDYKNTLEPGSFGTLKELLQQSIYLPNGRSKMVSEIESEMADARGTYATVGSRIAAILQGELDWGYIRIVAKSGGQYSTIQAAINSITSTAPHLILIMPDGGIGYDESVEIPSGLKIGFKGIGMPTIGPNLGRIISANPATPGYIYLVDGIRIECNVSQTYTATLDIHLTSTIDFNTINNVVIINNSPSGSPKGIKMNINSPTVQPRSIIFDSRIVVPAGVGIYYTPDGTCGGGRSKIINTRMNTSSYCIESDIANGMSVYTYECGFKTDAANSIVFSGTSGYLYMAHCRYCAAPSTANVTIDYGTLVNVSNVSYDSGDLWILV